MSGRSRGARTWEFYCDSGARNASTEQAEREESGSATAAIEMIRSQRSDPPAKQTQCPLQKHDSTRGLEADAQGASDRNELTQKGMKIGRWEVERRLAVIHITLKTLLRPPL